MAEAPFERVVLDEVAHETRPRTFRPAPSALLAAFRAGGAQSARVRLNGLRAAYSRIVNTTDR